MLYHANCFVLTAKGATILLLVARITIYWHALATIISLLILPQIDLLLSNVYSLYYHYLKVRSYSAMRSAMTWRRYVKIYRTISYNVYRIKEGRDMHPRGEKEPYII